MDVHSVVNDGLMTLFFLLAGLEIKRQLVTGELRDRRAAALPAIAALGGMVVPAVIYIAFNAWPPGADGWGIPWPPTSCSRSASSPWPGHGSRWALGSSS